MARDLAQNQPELLIEFQKIAASGKQGGLTNFDNIAADAYHSRMRGNGISGPMANFCAALTGYVPTANVPTSLEDCSM
jgi:hypothetical protein